MEAAVTVFIAIAGFAGAFYAWRKKMTMSLSGPLVFFSLMGMLQGFSQTIANQCALPANQMATVLAYVHVCFQPFMINAAALHFINRRVSQRIDLYVYMLCFTGMTMMLIQGYPFDWAGRCAPGSLMCGDTVCTLRDSWHLAWMLPITQFGSPVPFYFITAIVLPIVYGSWRFMLMYMLCCPVLAFLITHNMNEWPAVSAMLTIPFLLLLVAESKLRDKMVIKDWLVWRVGMGA